MVVMFCSGAALAEVGPKNGDTWKPVLPTKREVRADDPLIVGDVIVDKTAENSVVARDQAIADARKAAFQKLAERNMTPEAFKAFKMPSDKDIGMMVQDFEIKNEQMSSTRYVGNFTVRFRDVVKNYMTIRPLPVTGAPATATAAALEVPEQAAGTPDTTAESGDAGAAGTAAAEGVKLPTTVTERDSEPLAQSVLVLPYYEDIAGKTLLWEENNPWLMMWQGALPKTAAGASRQFFVPLGDISDVATGASNAVWSGDYRPLEKLRSNYGAEEVVLAVANKSAEALSVDLYTYNHNHLRKRATLTPYVGEAPEEVAYKKAMTEVLQYLQQPGSVRKGPRVEDISREVTHFTRANGYAAPQAGANGAGAGTTTVITRERAPLVVDPPLTVQTPSQTPSQTQAQARGQVQTHIVPPLTVDDMHQPYAPQQQTYTQQPPIVRTVGMQPVYSTGDAARGSAEGAPAYSGGGATMLAATMQFDNPRSWMDVQRRLSSLNPPVKVNITSLNSNSVAFTLSSDSPVEALRQALSARGVALGAPVTASTGRPVYDVRLAQ